MSKRATHTIGDCDLGRRVTSVAAIRERPLRQLHQQSAHCARDTARETEALLARVISAQEQERLRIARDLHDQLGQQMTALRLHLRAWRAGCAGHDDLDAHADRTERLAEELDRAIDALTWQLRPAALEHQGLSAALEQLVMRLAEQAGMSATVHASGVGRTRLRPEDEANLYRIVQEALHNVIKHAHATRVTVMMTRRHDELVVVIEDNGRGFETSAALAGEGLGLIGMRERVTLLGGRLDIESVPGTGTGLSVRIPMRATTLA